MDHDRQTPALGMPTMIASPFDRTECYAKLGEAEKRLGAAITEHLNAQFGLSDPTSRAQWGQWYATKAFLDRTDNVRSALQESERIALRHLEAQLGSIRLAQVWPVLGRICHDIALFLGGGAIAGSAAGGAIGLAVSGAGMLPGALAGSTLGMQAGSMLLSFLGLKSIATEMVTSVPQVARAYSDGFLAAWGAVPRFTAGSADGPHFGAQYRTPDIHRAARDFARGHELLVVALLTAIVAYLTRDGRLSMLLTEIRQGSRLGPRFAQWVEQNADRLSSHPLLQERAKAGSASPSGGGTAPASSGRAPARTRRDQDVPPSSLRGAQGLVGTSEGGPGIWQRTPRRAGGETYQEQITGAQRGIEYAVTPSGGAGKPVHFDGYDAQRGVLLDAKDWKNFPPDGSDFWEAAVFKEAKAQVHAADGIPVEWHFSSQKGYEAVDTLFSSRGLEGIRLVITPQTTK